MSELSEIIATRLMPPRVGERSVPREQLLVRLHESRACRLVLITGGAGFGKSMLMAQWRLRLAAAGARVAWLSLDQADGLPARFLAGLRSALVQGGLTIEGRSVKSGEDEDGTLQAVSVLINALVGVRGELYLMIDDFHHAGDPGITSLLQALIDAAVPGLHLVIASRAMPSLLLGRLRAAGEVEAIESNELLFLPRETATFLEKQLGSPVNADMAARLHEQTEGWPAGLQLSLAALRKSRRTAWHCGEPGIAIGDLADYLSEDVLVGLPDDLLEFMQGLSVLRRFRSDLAACVTGVTQAGAMIDAIAARSLFLSPVEREDAGSWYRFHPIFARFLRERLAHGSADVRSLHKRACEWFERHRMLTEAMHHALACGEPDMVVAMSAHDIPVGTLNEVGCFHRWIQRLSPQQLSGHPRLLLLGVWACVLSSRPAQAQAWLALLDKSRDNVGSERERQLLRAMVATHHDDAPGALAAMECVGDMPMDGSPLAERVRLALRIWWLAAQGDHAQARSLYNSPVARTLRRSTDELALLGVASAAMAALLEGNVLQAERIGGPALELAEARHGRRSISACVCAAAVGAAWYEMGRIDDACHALANRMDILCNSSPEVIWRATLTKARLKLLLETPRAALEYLAGAETHWRGVGFERGIAMLLAEQIRVALMVRDVRHAQELLMALEDMVRRQDSEGAANAEIRGLANLSAARLALAMGAPGQVLKRLAAAQGWAARYGRGADQVTVTLLQAMAEDYLGRSDEAASSLLAAVGAGYRLGLQRTFRDEGDQLRGLLGRLRGDLSGNLAEYLEVLIGLPAHAGPGGAGAPSTRSSTRAADLPMLSEREQQIMALLAQSMSNKRIAIVLDLSVQTIKWNLKKIFAKFGVSSRYEAVVAARERGLRLDPRQ